MALRFALRPGAVVNQSRPITTSLSLVARRTVTTLPNNPHIYVHDGDANSSILSLLSTTPVKPFLSLGTTTQIPPTPDSFTTNRDFLELVHDVIAEHAAQDPEVQAQAATYASQAGASLGSGGVFFPHHQQNKRQRGASKAQQSGGHGSGGASAQGGIGGGGRGGYIHVSDQRNPADFGRVSWPEDIFGSLEIDGEGKFVDGHGRYQRAGTYRMVTREGIFGISPFLREKLVARLKELDAKSRSG